MNRVLNILLIEPNEDMARVLARTLNAEQHAVVRAATRAEAEAICEIGRFDVVITDLRLPDGDATALVGEGGPCHRVPSIALTTAYDDPDEVARAESAGFSAVLSKPALLPELWAAIRRVTGP